MFKKFLIGVICLCLLIIMFVVYSFYAPVTMAGNKTYEDEYYYNDINSAENSMVNKEPLYDTLKNDVPYDMSLENYNLSTDAQTGKTLEEIYKLKGFNENIPKGLAKNKERDMMNTKSHRVLITRDYPLPMDYTPDDLIVPDILFTINHYDEKKLMRQKAAQALEKMFADSEAEGLSITAISGYRSYSRQNQIYQQNLVSSGEEHTGLYSAKPGCSEHQSGLSMDVSSPSADYRLEEDFADTPEGKWLDENCYKYGFIIRYPKDKSEITGYAYEPWHIRFVGKKLAKYLYKNNITLEEYYGYTPGNEITGSDGYGNSIDVEDSSYYTDNEN